MDYRHEYKFEIGQADLFILRQRLRAVARPDPHAESGKYLIRSLYFDNDADKALREKLDGVKYREKFRIRYYNGDTSFIRLEKKTKEGSLGKKQSAVLTAVQVQDLLNGCPDWMPVSGNPLICELYAKMRMEGFRPKVIVDYTREPFIYTGSNILNMNPGNVRVTLDYNIRTGFHCKDFLSPDCVTIPAGNAPAILEVKWDSFLPDIIRDAILLPGRRAAAFSKYAQCRIYG